MSLLSFFVILGMHYHSYTQSFRQLAFLVYCRAFKRVPSLCQHPTMFKVYNKPLSCPVLTSPVKVVFYSCLFSKVSFICTYIAGNVVPNSTS